MRGCGYDGQNQASCLRSDTVIVISNASLPTWWGFAWAKITVFDQSTTRLTLMTLRAGILLDWDREHAPL